MALEPIDIIVHDYPTSFPVSMKGFVRSFVSFVGGIKYKTKIVTNIKTFTSLRVLNALMIKSDIFVSAFTKLNAFLKLAITSKPSVKTTTELNASLRMRIVEFGRIKTFTMLNPIIGIFYNWKKDAGERWSDLPSDGTIGNYVKEEI